MQIYDVYGKSGLAAGLEIGPHLSNPDTLKREWQAFQVGYRSGCKAMTFRVLRYMKNSC